MKKIKKDDMVIVIAGRDKSRSGRIIKILPNNRALVEGVNVLKKHVKPNPHKNTQGGIIDREASIHLSNLALMNPLTNKADKIGMKLLEPKSSGEKIKKVRYFKSNNEIVDVMK